MLLRFIVYTSLAFVGGCTGLLLMPTTPQERMQAYSKMVEAQLDPVYSSVYEDAKKQYFIAKQNGQDLAQICVQAQMVQQAALQAKNESEYSTWTQRAQDECQAHTDAYVQEFDQQVHELAQQFQ